MKSKLLKWILIIFTIFVTGCAHRRVPVNSDLVNYGVKLAEKGFWKEAAVQWRKVLQQEPQNIAALNNIAIAAEAQGFPEKAFRILSHALSFKPDSRYIRWNVQAMVKRREEESSPAADKEGIK